MCYSAKDSAAAYGINLISCAALFFFARDAQFKVLALFLLFVGQMQLFDYYFWNHEKCDKANNIMTKFAIGFNHYQPSVLFFLQKLYGFHQSLESLIVLGAFSIYSMIYNLEAFKKVDCTLPKNGTLEWAWTELDGNYIFYPLFVLYLVIASFNFTSRPVQIAAALVSIVSFLVANKRIVLDIHMGRAWCYFASLMPLVFLALNFLLPKT